MHKKLIALTVSTLILIAAVIVVRSLKDEIILYNGIKTYRMISSAVQPLCFISSAALLIYSTIIIKRFDRHMKKKAQEIQVSESGVLTDYDRKKMYNDLYEDTKEKFPEIKGVLGKLLRQYDLMDEYQRNLNRLLDNNDSNEIENVPELLQKMEDCMYTNMKKLLNYVWAVSQLEHAFIQQKFEDCFKKNSILLSNVQEFTVAVADYINNGVGGDEKSILTLKTYKDQFLRTIDETDIYLN